MRLAMLSLSFALALTAPRYPRLTPPRPASPRLVATPRRAALAGVEDERLSAGLSASQSVELPRFYFDRAAQLGVALPISVPRGSLGAGAGAGAGSGAPAAAAAGAWSRVAAAVMAGRAPTSAPASPTASAGAGAGAGEGSDGAAAWPKRGGGGGGGGGRA